MPISWPSADWPARILGPKLWDLAKRIWGRIEKHELFTQASAVAFYALAALVPFLGLILLVAARLLPDMTGTRAGSESLGLGDMTVDELKATVRNFFPEEAAGVIEGEIARIQEQPAAPVLSIGAAVTIWMASSAFVSIMDAMNVIHEVAEPRGFWKRRLVAIGLTILQAFILVGSLGVIVLWPQIVGWLGMDVPTAMFATVVQWVLVFVMLALSFKIALHFAPAKREKDWSWFTPGSLLGTVALILASLGFQFYVQNWGNYSATYGSLGGAIVLLAWMWVAAFVLLTASAIDAEVERSAPPSPDPAEA